MRYSRLENMKMNANIKSINTLIDGFDFFGLHILILQELLTGQKTRPELVKKLKIARTTIFDYLSDLMKMGIVFSNPIKSNKKGRHSVIFYLSTEYEGIIKKGLMN